MNILLIGVRQVEWREGSSVFMVVTPQETPSRRLTMLEVLGLFPEAAVTARASQQ